MIDTKILSRKFYNNDTVKVAKNLLGKNLVRVIGKKTLSGIIIETEAYKSKHDPASHAVNRMTSRNKAMFGQVGRAYVYFTYGNYFMLNAVARAKNNEAGAVLIRSIYPQDGIKIMLKNRKNTNIQNLTNGPGKLTQAMQISTSQYGTDLTKKSDVFITEGVKPKKIIKKSRVGITKGIDKLWNFSFQI